MAILQITLIGTFINSLKCIDLVKNDQTKVAQTIAFFDCSDILGDWEVWDNLGIALFNLVIKN